MTIFELTFLAGSIIVGLGAGRILSATATERFFPNPDQVRDRNVRGAMIAGILLATAFSVLGYFSAGFKVAVVAGFLGGIALPVTIYIFGTLRKIIKKEILRKLLHGLIDAVTSFFAWCDRAGTRMMLWIRKSRTRRENEQ